MGTAAYLRYYHSAPVGNTAVRIVPAATFPVVASVLARKFDRREIASTIMNIAPAPASTTSVGNKLGHELLAMLLRVSSNDVGY